MKKENAPRFFCHTLAVLTGILLWHTAVPAPAGPPRKARNTPKPQVPTFTRLTLLPAEGILDGSYAFQTLSVTGQHADGSALDVTPQATFSSSNPSIVRVSKEGVAYPVNDGTAEVVASFNGRTARARFVVRNTKTDANLCFENAVTPLLLKYGCLGSACHNAPNGQAGFKLSYFGYEPEKDWEAIVKDGNGRRVNFANPAESLIVKKATGWGHGGGKRFAPDGPEARLLIAWIRAGAPFKPGDGRNRAHQQNGPRLARLAPEAVKAIPKLLSLQVLPESRLIRQAGSRHQLVVLAHYDDGNVRDVTPFCRFVSDDDGIVSVSSSGKLTALRRGEANIMVRYAGKVGLASINVQPQPPIARYPKIPANNFIDELVFAKLKTINVIPSDLCDDATFIRRAFFDIAGTPPLPAMVRQFIENRDPNKRRKLVDELLERPEFKNYQSILWADLLRSSKQVLQEDGVKAYNKFIRESFAENKPFDRFVRELLTGTGSTFRNETATANYYRVTGDPMELTTSTTQIFLGIRTDCARCHNHPFDRWSQDDFYGFAAFFAGVQQIPGPARDEYTISYDENARIRQPRTGQVMPPKFLGADAPLSGAKGDLRVQLAQWITAKDNPFFARAIVNRVWKQFFGRGIVHPVDDFRATNPPINAPLLDALAQEFVNSGFDLKHLIRTICNSRVYQLSSVPNATNATDTKNFSRYYLKRLGPQQLLDAIVVATGVEESYPGQPPATRAINLIDNTVSSYFLDVFGRSRRIQIAEPNVEPTMSQALALMNSPTLHNKITDPNGRIAQLIARLGDRGERAILTEIYLATLARFPTEAELTQASAYIAKVGNLKEAYEDLMWALLNSKEFLFNH